MEQLLGPLLSQIIGGALGGNAAAKASPNFDLGSLAANTISGLVGGGVLGQILQLVLPQLLAGNMSLGSIVSNVIGGGAGGAILTAIIGMLKNRA